MYRTFIPEHSGTVPVSSRLVSSRLVSSRLVSSRLVSSRLLTPNSAVFQKLNL